MIGVIVPKVASASIGRIVEGILSILNESEYQTLLAVTQNNPQKESEYLSAFNNKQVDGVILSATVFTAEHKRILKNMLVPVVIVGQHLTGYHCVFHDDYHAAYDLTKLLLQKEDSVWVISERCNRIKRLVQSVIVGFAMRSVTWDMVVWRKTL